MISVHRVDPTDPNTWSDTPEWSVSDPRDPYGLGWRNELGFTKDGKVCIQLGGSAHQLTVEDARIYAQALLALAHRAEHGDLRQTFTATEEKAA